VIGRRRFARDRRGRFRPGLEAPEGELLRTLALQALELVDQDEPSARRLFPVAYPGDHHAQAEYRDMMGGQLLEHHRQALEVLSSTADADAIEHGDLHAWLGAIEVLRLVLGTELDVSEDVTEVLPGDPRTDQFAVYRYLSMLQDEIVDTLARALPAAGSGAGADPVPGP